MMIEQLRLDGGADPYPTPHVHRLTERQRDLLTLVRYVASYDGPFPTTRARPFYADPSGALRRLERLGLVRRCGRGEWTT